MCVPLSTAEGAIGALEVINRRGGGLFERPTRGAAAKPWRAGRAGDRQRATGRGLVEQQRIRRELDLARKIQKSLLPRRRRGNFPLIGMNLPAHEISGDFYDYFDLADGRIAFVIGDISGKGLDAALLMVRAASLLRWAARTGIAPREVVGARERGDVRDHARRPFRLRAGRLVRSPRPA